MISSIPFTFAARMFVNKQEGIGIMNRWSVYGSHLAGGNCMERSHEYRIALDEVSGTR
jgi:hypothetical protein